LQSVLSRERLRSGPSPVDRRRKRSHKLKSLAPQQLAISAARTVREKIVESPSATPLTMPLSRFYLPPATFRSEGSLWSRQIVRTRPGLGRGPVGGAR
jgi:hypothetical protein